MCFVLTLDKDKPKKEFDLIKETMNYIVQKYGYQSASYCVILRKNNELIGDINFEERCSCEATLQKRIAELEQPSSPALLFKDLDDVCSAFRAPNVRKKAKKVRYMRARDRFLLLCRVRCVNKGEWAHFSTISLLLGLGKVTLVIVSSVTVLCSNTAKEWGYLQKCTHSERFLLSIILFDLCCLYCLQPYENSCSTLTDFDDRTLHWYMFQTETIIFVSFSSWNERLTSRESLRKGKFCFSSSFSPRILQLVLFLWKKS